MFDKIVGFEHIAGHHSDQQPPITIKSHQSHKADTTFGKQTRMYVEKMCKLYALQSVTSSVLYHERIDLDYMDPDLHRKDVLKTG
jgi:hypothetical protein